MAPIVAIAPAPVASSAPEHVVASAPEPVATSAPAPVVASALAPVVATAPAPVRSSRKANTFARRLLSFIFTNEGAHGIVIGVNKPVCAPIAEELRVNQGSAIAQLRRMGLIEEFEIEPPHARVLTLKNINWVRTRVSAAGVDLLLQKSG
jgi:hypothetical protein